MRGRDGLGIGLGLVFGPIGIVAAACLPSTAERAARDEIETAAVRDWMRRELGENWKLDDLSRLQARAEEAKERAIERADWRAKARQRRAPRPSATPSFDADVDDVRFAEWRARAAPSKSEGELTDRT